MIANCSRDLDPDPDPDPDPDRGLAQGPCQGVDLQAHRVAPWVTGRLTPVVLRLAADGKPLGAFYPSPVN